MAYENLKLKKRNFTVDQGYFYMFDESQDNLLQKTDDGNTSFSYPFDILMTQQVLSVEHDGVYFWSLEKGVDVAAWADATDYVVLDKTKDGGDVYECIQNHTSSSTDRPGVGENWEDYWSLLAESVITVDMVIKRWKIENYVCKLQETFTIAGTIYGTGAPHAYNSEAFSVEHYHTTLTSSVAVSGTTLYLNEYSDHASMNFTTTSGDPLTLHLGPNSSGEEEDVQVNTTISGGVDLVLGTQYAYASSDKVNYYTNIWMFNDYDGIDSSTGALYKFDAYTGDYLTKYSSGAYKDVGAATFYKVDSFTEYGNIDTLVYIKGTNMLFVNTSQAGATLPYYGSAVMDNIKKDEATVRPVYDLAMDDQNVYRLQQGATYYDTDNEWSYYSYQLSSLDSFVASISLAAYPAIIAANEVSTSEIIVIVVDQFLQPITSLYTLRTMILKVLLRLHLLIQIVMERLKQHMSLVILQERLKLQL